MLNQCMKCHHYSVKKKITKEGNGIICPNCGDVQSIERLPLFVVTGASEVGKTSAATILYLSETDFMIMDCDQLWVSDIFNDHEGGYRMFREVWLRLAKNMSQIGKPVVLVGCAEPKQYEICNERKYFTEIHYLALYCEPKLLEKRLVAKYKGTDPNYIDASLKFNDWLRDSANTTQPPMTLLDVSSLNIAETAEEIDHWIKKSLKMGEFELDREEA